MDKVSVNYARVVMCWSVVSSLHRDKQDNFKLILKTNRSIKICSNRAQYFLNASFTILHTFKDFVFVWTTNSYIQMYRQANRQGQEIRGPPTPSKGILTVNFNIFTFYFSCFYSLYTRPTTVRVSVFTTFIYYVWWHVLRPTDRRIRCGRNSPCEHQLYISPDDGP
jgi:hypothetical protein